MIPVQNIYHMLSYAFTVLQGRGYRKTAAEKFENIADFYAAILVKGFEAQLKRGLGNVYTETQDTLPTLRGRLDFSDTLRSQSLMQKKLVCSFAELSTDTPAHRILRATFEQLLKTAIPKHRKKQIRSLLPYLSGAVPIHLQDVQWKISCGRLSPTYRMLVNICWLLAEGLLQTQTDGKIQLMDFLDEQRMHALYERFVREYYRQEHPSLKVRAAQIPWALDDGFSHLLPIMRSDIMIEKDDRVLIIDTKYYAHSLQSHYLSHTLHSGNLYQIFTYVKNKQAQLAAAGSPGEVAGMLLYAKTDDKLQPEGTYQMSGSRIGVRTLDLNQDFSEISGSLDQIVQEHFYLQE